MIDPGRYSEAPVYDLLIAAAKGKISFDCRLLHSIIDRFPGAIADVVRFGVVERDDDLIDVDDELISIFRYCPAPEAVPYLVESVRRYAGDIPGNLIDALCRVGQPAVEPLLKVCEEFRAGAIGEVSFVLAALQVHDPRVLDLLIGRLKADPADAALQLGLYGDPAAIPALEAFARELEAAGGETSADALSEIRQTLDRLKDPDRANVIEEYDIWDDFPETSLPWFEYLTERERLEFINSPVPEYRVAAVEHLGTEFSPELKQRIFDVASNDSAAEVRGACWEALRFTLPDAAIREAMVARLRDASVPMVERKGALFGLCWQQDDPVVAQAIDEFYESRETRALALEAIWRSGNRQYSDRVVRHLDDSDEDIQRQAILCVGMLEIGSQAGRLIEFFANDELREDALYAYARAVPGEVSRLRMRQLFNRIDELAGGLSHIEAHDVEGSINTRLELHGLDPLSITDVGEHEHEHDFDDEDEHERMHEETEAPTPAAKVGRNDPCPCGSGKKYKKCCGR